MLTKIYVILNLIIKCLEINLNNANDDDDDDDDDDDGGGDIEDNEGPTLSWTIQLSMWWVGVMMGEQGKSRVFNNKF